MDQLVIQDLHVSIAEQEIIRGLSLTVPKGEVHAIMGPNGSGKSTLAKVMAGHPDYVVTAGSVTMDGENILELEPDERARKGLFMAFQYPSEIPGVTIANFLRAAVQARLPEGEELEATDYYAKPLQENGPPRDGSFVHLPLGQRRFLRRREEAERDSADGHARAEIRRARRDRQRPRHRCAEDRRARASIRCAARISASS